MRKGGAKEAQRRPKGGPRESSGGKIGLLGVMLGWNLIRNGGKVAPEWCPGGQKHEKVDLAKSRKNNLVLMFF